MKCAFSSCGNVSHLPLTLTDNSKSETFCFCGWAHLCAWLIERISQVTNVGLGQIASALQTGPGRKMIVQYLSDKFL